VPRQKSRRPTLKVKSTIHEPSSYGITAEFSWVHEGQLYGGLFSLTGIPDQNKLVAEVHNCDAGVEVRNETAMLHKVRARVPGAPSGRAAHIIQLARVRDSGMVNMHDIKGVYRCAYSSGFHSLVEWMDGNGLDDAARLSVMDSHAYHQALVESAYVTFDNNGDAIERV
jgi:hypothetical protein